MCTRAGADDDGGDGIRSGRRFPESQAEKKEEPRSLSGTWVMLLEGHQVGLEVEDKAGTLEGTLYIMGQRVPVDGIVRMGRSC